MINGKSYVFFLKISIIVNDKLYALSLWTDERVTKKIIKIKMRSMFSRKRKYTQTHKWHKSANISQIIVEPYNIFV